ncbi:MAG: NAD(P)/FAD-dependent oxidoreductase [Candidatus Helarchaeota archaeon]
MINCEVLIIGAGPAGSTCATFLSKAGIRTILIDKDTFPRDKPCSGALTTRIFKRFPYLSAGEVVESIVHGGYLYTPDLKSNVKIEDTESPVGYMVLRGVFDNYLVQKAIQSGAEFFEGIIVKEISFQDDKIVTSLKDGRIITSKIIIGADGALSIVARKSNLKKRWKDDELGICIFIENEINEKQLKKYNPNRLSVHIHIGYKDIFGYFWTFFKKDHLNIGLGCLLSEKKRKKVNLKDSFLDYLKINGNL